MATKGPGSGSPRRTPRAASCTWLWKRRIAPPWTAFHREALVAGGIDNGAPGLRRYYHPDYYGAFVLDPDGHNIEAVCREPA
jgi:hypothetical protein